MRRQTGENGTSREVGDESAQRRCYFFARKRMLDMVEMQEPEGKGKRGLWLRDGDEEGEKGEGICADHDKQAWETAISENGREKGSE